MCQGVDLILVLFPEKLAGIFQVRRPAMAIAIANFFGSARSFR